MANFLGAIFILAFYIGFRIILDIFGFWAGMAYLGSIFAIIWLIDAIPKSVEGCSRKTATHETLKEVMSQIPRESGVKWQLPAPESLVLLRGVHQSGSDAFKLGVLQLIWTGALTENETTKTLQKQAVSQALAGSLKDIYSLCEPVPGEENGLTVREVAAKAKKEYGSLTGFVTTVVVPELQKAGLYTTKGTLKLTAEGEAARLELESRMSSVLARMQQSDGRMAVPEFCLATQDSGRLLMAALVGVAVGTMLPIGLETISEMEQAQVAAATAQSDGNGLDFDLPDLIGRNRPSDEKQESDEQENGADTVSSPSDATGFETQTLSDPGSFTFADFDKFDTAFASIDSGVGSDIGAGDGWSGGDGGCDGGGDCGGGDFGGGDFGGF